MSELRKITRALISVSDKTGLLPLAQDLTLRGVEIVSTGGTAAFLRNSGITVTDVSEVTGFPEMMDGRVKTLHPRVHGALLALRDNADHAASLNEHEISQIDLLVVNLYPFEAAIAKAGATLEDAVENIDIGGPAMIRSAAKNWSSVAVVTDPARYEGIINELAANDGSLSLETRAALAAAAFARTAEYDTAIADFLNARQDNEQFPETARLTLAKASDLRYGENPHQKAALYRTGTGGIASAEQLHGKEMSFNNYVDADAAFSLVNDFDETAVAIIKHTNPSGVGIAETPAAAYKKALSTDPVSAFGGIIAFNRKVDAEAAKAAIEIFSEVIIGPEFDNEALEIFRTKKNLRILKAAYGDVSASESLEYKQISGGFLVQDKDVRAIAADELHIVTERTPSDEEFRSMMLAWRVCKHVRSNAIVLASADRTLGVGAGQMNRVDSVRIAAMRAERFDLPLSGCALASDAFFPFRDNVDEAARIGITAIIQPGGSVRDEECIAAANETGIAMAFTGVRHFKH